jgi:hypothetical protein
MADMTESSKLPGPDQPYDDVRANAGKILDRLAAGTMPCDGAWPAYQVEVFRRWTQTGMRP